MDEDYITSFVEFTRESLDALRERIEDIEKVLFTLGLATWSDNMYRPRFVVKEDTDA